MAEAHAKQHDYHLVNPSPWPFVASVGAFALTLGGVAYMHGSSLLWLVPGLLITLYVMYAWWADIIAEGQQGHHTRVVQLHLRYGMILFIASEVMFFVAWFWAFFDASLFASEAQNFGRYEFTGGHWPPKGIEVFDPWHLPLLNTLILLTSGTTLTWAHHALLHNDRDGLKWGLILTVVLGLIFSCVQVYEYMHASFSFGGNIYGATFFMATGFHGFHVFIGTVFLIVCLFRALAGQFTPKEHFGLEGAAWYWHFVDVVWLFLFFAIYVWGGWGGTMHGA